MNGTVYKTTKKNNNHTKIYRINRPGGPRAYLFVPGADLAIEVQGLLGLVELLTVQKVGTDHHAGPALAGLAVYGRHMVVIFAQPLVQVLTEGLYELQLGRVVVLERILGH